jgi:hypothetical protein
MHVFISYSHADGDFAEVLRTRLKGGGFDVWTDEDRLLAGEDWRNGIDQAIRSACTLIVVVTPSAKASEYVTYEWAFAWGVGVKVIPILLEPTPLHPRLEVLQYLDFSIRSARPWDKLLERLKEVSGNSRTGSPRGQDGVVLSIPGIVQNALANLDNVDRDIRVQAVETLVSMQHPVARDAVVNALKHPMSDVREAAARVLGEIKDPAAVPALIEFQGIKTPAISRSPGSVGEKTAPLLVHRSARVSGPSQHTCPAPPHGRTHLSERMSQPRPRLHCTRGPKVFGADAGA